MCLERLDKTPDKSRKFAWKVVKKGDYIGTFLGPYMNTEYHSTNWNVAKGKRNIRVTSSRESYSPGFHVYTFRSGAQINREVSNGEIVKKVEIKGIVATGEQWYTKVIVCKKFRFVK